MATNTLLTPSIIAKEALMVLENNMVLAGLVHRDYSREFQHVGATVTIRKPTSFTAHTIATTITVQNITESSVQVALDTLLDVSFEVGTKQLSLDIVSFSEQTIKPAMRAHAQKVDTLLAALYADIAGHTDVSATACVRDIAELREQLNLQKCPMDSRYCVVHPTTEAAYLSVEAFLTAEKRGDTEALKQGSMGRVLGMDFYMDQNIPTHTSGLTSMSGSVKGEATVGATAMTVDDLTNAEIVSDNDVFKVAGDPFGYRVTNGPVTVASTAAVLTFTPGLKSVAADNAIATFQDDHKANLAFHKNAFALVTAPLAPPIGGAKAAIETYKGLSCRVVYDYTMSTKTNVISIDMLCGVKTLDADLAARLCDAN